MTMSKMYPTRGVDIYVRNKSARSHSVQGLATNITSPAMKIPLPPRLWLTDVEDESSDDLSHSSLEDGTIPVERTRIRSRFRHKPRASVNVPIGIFWDIENCPVPRGCSAINVVAAIRSKFLTGRREADFVVVCDVRKETPQKLQELNDAQVCSNTLTFKILAADEKLRQCMRRFGELHSSPAALLLISGDINFAADLSDFRHRKGMEVILVHRQNTSSALIACASSHYSYNELTVNIPRNVNVSGVEEEDPSREMEVINLPMDQPPQRVSRRLLRLADNCGGKVMRVGAGTALLRFPTPDHASRALKRMDGEDVFGRKISTRYARTFQSTYSSDEGYSTGQRPQFVAPVVQPQPPPPPPPSEPPRSASSDWALALQQLPAPTPPPLQFCPPPAPKPRKIRGTHGSASLDRSGCSSTNSDDRRENSHSHSHSRAVSPWNSSVSEHSEDDTDLTVSNLPPYEPPVLQEMLTKLFNQYVPVVRVSVWAAGEGPLATVVVRSEWDARLAIARVHKRRLDNNWAGRRLELSLGRPSPAPNLDVLRSRLRAILLDQKNFSLPLLRLRDAYASRHCCALTTSDIAKVKDTVVIHEGFGRMVQLVDHTPVVNTETEEAPWKCHIHAVLNTSHEDGSRILQPVYMDIAVLAKNTQVLLENHGGILPLLSFVECYEAMFPSLVTDNRRGVALELLLRSIQTLEVKDSPSRHLTWKTSTDSPSQSYISDTSRSSDRDRPRTAPALEPMLALFERELVDLLRTAPRCSIPFSKLIPAFHHHFGRQCRVADYGFTKLPDLLSALGNTIVVLGSGSYRVITISSAAQGRRWTSDLLKILKAQPGRVIHIHDLPQLYQSTIGRPFSTVDYGVCTMDELMEKVSPQSVIVSPEGTISLPRRTPTPEERTRTVQFAVQAVELLCYTPNLRMEFSRFVPAYHAHFGRQLRVAHYGCVKLVELFELIPEAVSVYCESSGERSVRLGLQTATAVMAQRLKSLAPVSITTFPSRYAAQFGAPPLPDCLDAPNLESLVYAAGGFIEGDIIHVGDSSQWANSALSACAVLSADRSVARGSTEEYFMTAFRSLYGIEPDVSNLMMSGVLDVSERHVCLTNTWRTVWRVAQILSDYPGNVAAVEIFIEYSKRYGPSFPNAELGMDAMNTFLSKHRSVFNTSDGRWGLSAGVTLPRPEYSLRAEDYSLHDTPPGQKGSRVFESPKTNIWSSPPASALPTPTALLNHDNRRRTRLAAQFDAA
ncbi:putative limkain b1 [Danaus plexippus plexippus]|uniref:Meiosis regulator and mRNA stability factor 1 n=1 Tax=Danaus plexippus plexippus TaxID=278856 RepID=A0A212EM15_DANPL|nr:meiosis regulator and mRNA stability factor 1 [Danaus plexippus plexippus]OWR42532.1 putative limkain b1 [Danaus plexippus plexippus]